MKRRHLKDGKKRREENKKKTYLGIKFSITYNLVLCGIAWR
jgi:hypothetical protein